MNVFIVGSGGREHVLAWKIKPSSLVDRIFCVPGNGGMAQISTCEDIKADDIKGLLDFAKKNKVDLTVVGPEVSLAAGIVDIFEKEGLKIFGPSQKAARLESSKIFAKEFMKKYAIPTACFERFDDPQDAYQYLDQAQFPVVIKADGLAAGKGVIIADDKKQARAGVEDMMEKKIFQEAGRSIIIEECLKGQEASILAISDGDHFVLLDSSQDHKRIFDQDQGPNTGGMGAYSPAPIVTDRLIGDIEKTIIAPVIEGMKKEGTPFKGVLYAGLMITDQGPKVLEFNVRFGDPEAQAVIPRIQSDLVEILLAACEGRLDQINIRWDPRFCVCVVMSSAGYPGAYEKKKEIAGLEHFLKAEDVVVFHAGTKRQEEKIITSGGRVLGVTALGEDIEKAIERVYQAVEKIHFDGCYFRRDIAAKALAGIGNRKELRCWFK